MTGETRQDTHEHHGHDHAGHPLESHPFGSADHVHDAACAVAHGAVAHGAVAHGTVAHATTAHGTAAHGTVPTPSAGRTLVAVFMSPVAEYLLRYGADAGYRPVLVEPDSQLAKQADAAGFDVRPGIGSVPDDRTDVVVTDHHRDDLGVVLRDALASPARWVGIMGSPRAEPPHLRALALLGVEPGEVARVHRPIGLNIGSKTPPEIAIATLAGLIADRNERPGGFHFD